MMGHPEYFKMLFLDPFVPSHLQNGPASQGLVHSYSVPYLNIGHKVYIQIHTYKYTHICNGDNIYVYNYSGSQG